MEEQRDVLENEDTQKDKYLIFSIGEESYGMPIRYVIEIIGIEQITPVPELPNYVKGIINLRGKVISVMDARLRLKKDEREYDDRTCIIVIDIEGTSFGLIVDSVKEVASVSEENISPAPSINSVDDFSRGFIEAIGKVENDIWLFIDCKKLLYNEELDKPQIN